MRLLLSQWSSSDMNFQPLGWLNTTCTIVTCSGLSLWDMWDIYEWYCYFIAKLYWEAWGLFWKRSVSLFLRGVLFFVCCLFVFWLGCLVLVFAVCLCWLLLCCWMGDTLGIVSLYSHAWEWTISTNGVMTVRASSSHGTSKKKKAGAAGSPGSQTRQGLRRLRWAVLLRDLRPCHVCRPFGQDSALPTNFSISFFSCTCDHLLR